MCECFRARVGWLGLFLIGLWSAAFIIDAFEKTLQARGKRHAEARGDMHMHVHMHMHMHVHMHMHMHMHMHSSARMGMGMARPPPCASRATQTHHILFSVPTP